MADSDGGRGLCLGFTPVDIKPMRKTGGVLNPIQKLTLGVLKNAYPTDSKLIKGAGKLSELNKELSAFGVKTPLVITFSGSDAVEGIGGLRSRLRHLHSQQSLKTGSQRIQSH